MGEKLPDLMTLPDVLERLRGIVGRTYLLKHLREYPEFNGRPTHRRIGGKVVVRAEDYPRLLESLECRSKSSNAKEGKRYTSVVPSAEKAFMNAQTLLTRNLQKLSAPKEKRNSGRRVSMASGQ